MNGAEAPEEEAVWFLQRSEHSSLAWKQTLHLLILCLSFVLEMDTDGNASETISMEMQDAEKLQFPLPGLMLAVC